MARAQVKRSPVATWAGEGKGRGRLVLTAVLQHKMQPWRMALEISKAIQRGTVGTAGQCFWCGPTGWHQPTWPKARDAATAAMGVGVSRGLRLTVPVPHWPYRFCRSGRHAREW